MARRSRLLRIVRVAVAVVLGAAALLCAGLWIAHALSPPRPAGVRPDLSVSLSLSRYELDIWLENAQLRFWCMMAACPSCGQAFPNAHARECDKAGCVWVVSPHEFDVAGLWYWDAWDAQAGLLWASIWVPLWLLIALLAPYPLYVLVRGLLLRRSRRRPGACVACGYDLTGNVSGICPECGRPAVASS